MNPMIQNDELLLKKNTLAFFSAQYLIPTKLMIYAHSMKLKILSYNIHKGFTVSNKRFILEGIRTALRELNPDILFLQEVLGDHKTNQIYIPDWETQFEYLADTHWLHHAYGKNAVYSEGHHGNAILSKYPIFDWENTIISDHRNEPRGLLKARIRHESGQEILIANTHLDLSQSGRDNQARAIITDLKNETGPWILVGDFNDWNKKISPRIEAELGAQEALKSVSGKYLATFPSFYPMLSLDRIFHVGMQTLNAKLLTERHWRLLSDHLPLYAELDLPHAS